MIRTPLRRRSSRKALVTECDRLTKALMLRDRGDKCWRCGNQPVQAAHIMPKGQYRHMRFMPENMIPLCWRCHIPWAHKNPLDFYAFLVERLGMQELERLKVIAHQHHTKLDLAGIRLWLRQANGLPLRDAPQPERVRTVRERVKPAHGQRSDS